MKFSYSEFELTNGKKIYKPFIPIVFKANNKVCMVNAMVDSGADFTILPIELAGELDIKLDSKKKMEFFGAGNHPFNVYPSPIKIEHLIRKGGFKNLKWESLVYFAESQPAILLGNIGFLNKYKVTLDGINRGIQIL